MTLFMLGVAVREEGGSEDEGVAVEDRDFPPVMEVTDEGRRSFSAPEEAMPLSPAKRVQNTSTLENIRQKICPTHKYEICNKTKLQLVKTFLLKKLVSSDSKYTC